MPGPGKQWAFPSLGIGFDVMRFEWTDSTRPLRLPPPVYRQPADQLLWEVHKEATVPGAVLPPGVGLVMHSLVLGC